MRAALHGMQLPAMATLGLLSMLWCWSHAAEAQDTVPIQHFTPLCSQEDKGQFIMHLANLLWRLCVWDQAGALHVWCGREDKVSV